MANKKRRTLLKADADNRRLRHRIKALRKAMKSYKDWDGWPGYNWVLVAAIKADDEAAKENHGKQ